MDSVQAEKTFKAGDVIMRQGEPGDCAYFIEEGQVEIVMDNHGGQVHHVGTRGKGTIIGEMAIVDDQPRIATVRAVEDCKMLEITRDDFSRRIKNADPVMRVISQVILMRYRDTIRRADTLNDALDAFSPEALEREYVQQSNAVEGIKLSNELRHAIDNKQLTLHYQPIIDLQNNKVVGFEALMRWIHPEKGFISPAIFIPVAEESGLIVEASRWALREATQTLTRIEHALGLSHKLYVAVNMSNTDFADENFLEEINALIQETDVHPQQLHLEITERLLMSQPENAKATLEQCRDWGLSISIDDFGTGYSSLSYLHYYPIDTLKIDQSFIRNMNADDNAMELVKSIISLGQNLNMKIVAEGVEDQNEAKTLIDLGCDKCQGYYFCKPQSEEDVVATLKTLDVGSLV